MKGFWRCNSGSKWVAFELIKKEFILIGPDLIVESSLDELDLSLRGRYFPVGFAKANDHVMNFFHFGGELWAALGLKGGF